MALRPCFFPGFTFIAVFIVLTAHGKHEECVESVEDETFLLQATLSTKTVSAHAALSPKAEAPPRSEHQGRRNDIEAHKVERTAKQPVSDIRSNLSLVDAGRSSEQSTGIGTGESSFVNGSKQLDIPADRVDQKLALMAAIAQDDGEIEDASEDTQNVTLTDLLLSEIEFELHGQDEKGPVKNKIVLLLLHVFFLPAFFGADRCYMGQTCLGIAKGLTFGGFLIWAFIDWWVVVGNAIGKSTSINTFGFAADFERDTIDGAFYLSCAMIATFACTCCCSVCLGGAAQKG